MLEKVTMTKRYLKTPVRGNAGFTAIEIAMVAAVIAILSLIVLPIFRNRVEDAKMAAAQADLSALMKAQQVVKADIDAYARLEDLDNVELNGYTAVPTNGLDKEVPAFKYNKPSGTVSPDPNSRHYITTQAERTQLAGREDMSVWKGPYIAFQRAMKYEDISNAGTYPAGQFLLRSASGNVYAAIQDGNPYIADADNSRIPIDPWGNPYMFFPPTGNASDPSASNNASASSVIYSLGPDGMPGTGGTSAQSYTREYALQPTPPVDSLGHPDSDDLMVEF